MEDGGQSAGGFIFVTRHGVELSQPRIEENQRLHAGFAGLSIDHKIK